MAKIQLSPRSGTSAPWSLGQTGLHAALELPHSDHPQAAHCGVTSLLVSPSHTYRCIKCHLLCAASLDLGRVRGIP